MRNEACVRLFCWFTPLFTIWQTVVLPVYTLHVEPLAWRQIWGKNHVSCAPHFQRAETKMQALQCLQ